MMKARLPAVARALLLQIVAVLAGCATHPARMDPVQVSPTVYRELSCDDLEREMRFVAARTEELYDRLLERYRRDRWQAAFSWFYGITAFYLDGDGPEADQYSRLKGEFAALEIEAYRKDCEIEVASPEEVLQRAESAHHQ